MSGEELVVVPIVLGITLYLGYWVVRLGVRHGLRDHARGRGPAPQNARQGEE